MKEADLILSMIADLERMNIEVCSRYGDHEETKAYLTKKKRAKKNELQAHKEVL